MPDGITLDFSRAMGTFNQALARLASVTDSRSDQIVAQVALKVLNRVKTTWPVDTGYSRAAWYGPIKIGNGKYRIGNPAPYAATIEFGLYRGTGPRTEHLNAVSLGNGLFLVASGIFSTQAHAPLRRALAEAYGEISREIGRAQQQAWGR